MALEGTPLTSAAENHLINTLQGFIRHTHGLPLLCKSVQQSVGRILAAYSDTFSCGAADVDAIFEAIRLDCEISGVGNANGDVLRSLAGVWCV